MLLLDASDFLLVHLRGKTRAKNGVWVQQNLDW
jgi:hypothetical protein